MELLLLILFIVVGYFIAFSMILMRVNSKVSILEVALIVLVIYGSIVGAFIYPLKYFGELGFLLYIFCIFYSLIYWGYKGTQAIKNKNKIQVGPFLLFLSYILAVLYITLIMREESEASVIQMELFRWIHSVSHFQATSTFQHMLLNCAMFIPIGVVFPFISEKQKGKFIPSISFGMAMSVVIESGQLFLRSGICDIDDIVSNTLGTAIGALITIVYKELKR